MGPLLPLWQEIMKFNAIQKRLTWLFSQKATKWGFTGLALLATGLILGYLLLSQWDLLVHYQWQINWILLLPIFLLYTFNLLLVTQVWSDILSFLGVKGGILSHFRNYCISNLMKRLPGTIWYVAWRAQFYNSERGISPKVVSLASGIELAVFSIATVITAIIFSFPMILWGSVKFWVLMGVVIVCVAFLIPSVQRRLFSWAGETNVSIPPITLVKWIAEYVLTRLIGGSMLFLIVRLFYPLGYNQLVTVIGIHSLVAALSLAVFFLPTNLGFTEVGISLLLSTILPSSIAVIIVIANRILMLLFDLAWGGISLRIGPRALAINPKELL
jgi:uncharacterized membrane protein YbhN (UPF0104 family)